VTVGAGTPLHQLNAELAEAGRALTNLGDIDRQTIAGAISTGTHGTGAAFGGIATQVVGLELVLADGSVATCSAAGDDPELFSAARVGLGALGIITTVTIQTAPLFALRAEEGPMGLDELLERWDELTGETDHFEAYWWPHTRNTLTKRNTRVPLGDGLRRLSRFKQWWDDEFLSNDVFAWIVATGRRAPWSIPTANAVAARSLTARTYTDVSYRVFTSPRRVRFCEMEYSLARSAAPDVIAEVVEAIERSGLRIAFPVELRVAAADDIPLSGASGRDSVYLAFHVPAGVEHRRYFALVASVLDGYAGRPHWGKLHDLDAAELRGRYDRFDEFVAVRDRVDPDGVWSNAYLDRVLGPAPSRRPVR
jgi:L-gulonolactone oxidase